MKLIELIMAVLLALCMGALLVNSIIEPSPIKGMAVTLFAILFMACARLSYSIYKEWIYGKAD